MGPAPSGDDPGKRGKLAVREEDDAFLVVREEDPDDWLARFDKAGRFPAREWADNMVRVFNRRQERRSSGPPMPPGTRPGSYHPDEDPVQTRGSETRPHDATPLDRP